MTMTTVDVIMVVDVGEMVVGEEEMLAVVEDQIEERLLHIPVEAAVDHFVGVVGMVDVVVVDINESGKSRKNPFMIYSLFNDPCKTNHWIKPTIGAARTITQPKNALLKIAIVIVIANIYSLAAYY